ncbi:hypothetical protein B0H14DRAFT_3518187 [Mycena olivaceomarginata]|nr:hypothetical protein B0H14DRAFT_3518187 [Mycena olivaceomarginata]
MVNTNLEHTFGNLSLTREPFFHPRQGFEDKQGSETFEFYVVIQGHVPGIYTHWEDASVQVIGFKKSVHKKHTGWSAATQAWDAARQPVASPRTPPPLDRKSVKPSTPATPRAQVAASTTASTSLSSSASPPSTPSRPKRVLYVYSRGKDTTVYADSQQASSEMRRGLADGSFRKLEATSSVSNALAHATDSALEVYDISDIESDYHGVFSKVFLVCSSPSTPALLPLVCVALSSVSLPFIPYAPQRTRLPCCPAQWLMSKHKSGARIGNVKKRANVFSLQSFGHTLRDADPLQARAGDEHESGPGAESSASFASQDDGDEWQDLPAENLISPERLSSRKRKRYAATDASLQHWVEGFRDAYLRVLVTREGPMGQEGLCSCGEAARYRCSECHGVRMFCKGCILEAHRLRPLCRIEAWTGSFLERRELRQLGLRVQLGHSDNVPCTRAHRGHKNGSQHRWEQLLSYGWFPSTPDAPKSAIMISALKLFHAVSLQGKTTVYHFFNALAKITDNTGSRAFKRRYQLALRVVREWRSLRALKRGGMGNDPDRCAAETRSGELAVDCIACPKVGVNLPDGWESAPPEKRFLYAVYWAIDACFRLKRKMISSWAADPSIQDGWAYFTAWKSYGPFVKMLGEQKEMSTCTSLAALDHANTKYSQGYAATGCGMVTCGRHEVVAKNGVGDLQAGEKYGNMDYIVASAWQHWSKNLKERLLNLPPALRFHLVRYFVKFVIPKLHILGHLKKCQDFFSLLYTLGAAQADMEGIERIWSSSGLMGVSTREMGPGSRQDTLDDFWHFWNWNKVVGMGETLRKRFAKATKELARQQEGLEEFTEEQHDKVDAWKKAVDDFESGASLANPYELPQSGPSLRDIELELIREEQERERASAAGPEAGEDTMTGFLMLGLEIEGQQRELAADLLANRSPTTKNLTDFVTRRTRIARQVKKLRLMQRRYSPAAGTLPPLSVPELAAAEARLRDAQCAGSLDLIRHGLGVKRRLQTYKTLHSRCQHQTTRSRSLVDLQQRKIEVAAATYRQARLARLALTHVAGSASWRPLEKADLRMLEDEEEAKKRKQRAMKGKRKEAAQENEQGEVRGVPGMGEKNRLISWIWQGAGYTGGVWGQELQDGVRVEWCKAYARVKCWREEVLLLQEEMNRCLRTLEWQAGVWDQRATREHYCGRIVYAEAHLQGAMALAARQAAMRRKLASRFHQLWWSAEGSQAAGSSESSGGEEPDVAFGGHGFGNDSGSDDGDEGDSDVEPAGSGAGGAGAEMEGEMSGDELAARRAEMNTLLAIQTTSLGQYDDV